MSEQFELLPFEMAEPAARVTVTVRSGAAWVLDYRISGVDSLEWCAPEARPARRDGLWQQTCGECFIADPTGPGYLEFNFSPSGHWAAYRFTDVRRGMQAHDWSQGVPPRIEQFEPGAWRVTLPWQALRLSGQGGQGPRRLGLTLVAQGARGYSYWALRHPGATPDFHDPAGFIANLEVPSA